MRSAISSLALGLALAGGASAVLTPAAWAQTTFTLEPPNAASEVIVTQPVQSVQTTETVRTVQPAPAARPTRAARATSSHQAAHRRTAHRETVGRQVVTTRQTVVNQQVVPAPVVAAPAIAGTTVATYPQPLYGTAAPLYDANPPTVDDTMIAAPPIGAAVPTYRYVYEPDRILVIDPATNIAIQALPR